MPLIEWEEKLSVGVSEIDTQHKKLTDILNELNDAMKNGNGNKALKPILDGLVSYVSEHFSTEEMLMEKYDYTESFLHKKAHKEFVQKVKSFQKDFDSGKVLLTLDIQEFLKNWLVEHIMNIDKRFGIYLASKGIK